MYLGQRAPCYHLLDAFKPRRKPHEHVNKFWIAAPEDCNRIDHNPMKLELRTRAQVLL